MYIDTQEAMEAFVERAQSAQVLAIDTEFLREKTYYAQLCLLQLAADDEIAIVDPFKVRDLTVLASLFQQKSLMKLFHAGSQDLEILYRVVGVLPLPVFDTQIAAAVLGYAQQIGYASLVHSLCGVSLRKTDSFTDWSDRPLSTSQLDYAADDVRYLPQMYHSMSHELKAKGRLAWLDHDFAELSDPKRYEVDIRGRYKRLKRGSQLSRRQLSAARELAAWRETMAQGRNIPRKWVLSDEQIVEACKREARTIDELFMVRGMRERISTREAREIVALIIKGLDAPESQWPEPDPSRKGEPNVDVELDLMNALVRIRAKENDIAFQTLASHDDLVRLARGYRDDVDLLKGWRKSIVGDELLDLLAGRICLHIEHSKLVVEYLE